jgi:hypothetical protein
MAKAYSARAPRRNVAAPAPRRTRPAGVTKAQERALSQVRVHREHAEQFSRNPSSKEFLKAFRGYRKAVVAAARAGLGNHPDIAPLVQAWRDFHDRDALRDARLRAPKKNTRPLTKAEQPVFERVVELLDAGLSMAEIRRVLHAEKFIPSTHRERFRRLMDRLGVTLPPSSIRAVLLGNVRSVSRA